jgi:hypothetical protein
MRDRAHGHPLPTPALPTRQISGRRQQLLCAQPNRLQSLLGPLLNVLGGVALLPRTRP